MARVAMNRLSDQERAELRKELVRTVRTLRKSDTAAFLADLLTPGEVLMLARRIRVARRLLSGATYEEIAHTEHVSYSTIQLVDRAIERGLRGYRRAIVQADEAFRRAGRRGEPSQWRHLLRKVPGLGPYRYWLSLLGPAEDDELAEK